MAAHNAIPLSRLPVLAARLLATLVDGIARASL
jgi:hypothetical protein